MTEISEKDLPKLCLVYVTGICIGIGHKVSEGFHHVYLNTLLPELNKKGQPKNKDEQQKYADSVRMAKRIVQACNSYFEQKTEIKQLKEKIKILERHYKALNKRLSDIGAQC